MTKVTKILLAVLVLAVTSFANERLSGFCENGAVTVNTLTQVSTTVVQGSFPSCTVAVYITGTLTAASIYSDNLGTSLSNPFTAQNNGQYFFYAANGVYDLRFSGGGIPTPFTIGAKSLFDIANYTPPSQICGVNTEVLYSLGAGVCGADGNLVWDYTNQVFHIDGKSVSGSASLVLNSTTNSGFGISLQNAGIGIWETGLDSSNNFYLFGASAAQNVIAASPTGDITLSPVSGTIDIVSHPFDVAINVSGGSSYILSPGFKSNYASPGTWNAFNTDNDGALMRGYHLAANANNTLGGYIDIAPTTYNPNGGGVCHDNNGDVVTQPSPLPNISAFGSNDALLWVTTSPQMPINGSCGYILPINENYGLATNVYIFARGGLATDSAPYNAINTIYLGGGIPSGGVEANTIIAGTLYPSGTSTTTGVLLAPTYLGGHMIMGDSIGPPAVGTIATVTNPLSSGEGLHQGMFYFDDGTHTPWYYNGTAWVDWTGGGGGVGCTTGSIPGNAVLSANGAGCYGDVNFAYNQSATTPIVTLHSGSGGLGGSFETIGTNAGFDATSCTLTNCIQAPAGGVASLWLIATDSLFLIEEAPPVATVAGQGRFYEDASTHTPNWGGNAFNVSGTYYFPLAMFSGTLNNGHCTQISGSSPPYLLIDSGAVCGGGSGSGTVVASPEFTVAYYNTAGTSASVAGLNNGLTYVPTTGVLNFGSAGSGPGLTMANVSLSAPGLLQLTGSTSGIDVTTEANYNGIQIPGGGMYALSFSALNYMNGGNNGSGNNTPALTTNDHYNAGAFYYNVGLATEYFCEVTPPTTCSVGAPGTGWVAAGGSGSGTINPGSVGQIGVYSGTTTMSGYSGLTWNNSTTTLTVTGTGIATTGILNSSVSTSANAIIVNNGNAFAVNGLGAVSAAGVVSSTGAAGGFNVTSDTSYESIQTTGGIHTCNAGTTVNSWAFLVNGYNIVDCSHNAYLANVTASNVTASGAIQSTVSTSAAAILVNSGAAFEVNGLGAVSTAGVITSAAGLNVTTITNANSIQTLGGFNACDAGTCASGVAFEVNGNKLIDSSLNAFVHNITITGTCTGCTSAAVSSIIGTANEVLANNTSGVGQTGAVTLTTPQAIGTSSSVSFANVTVSGAFNSTATGTSTAITVNGGSFIVNGAGAVSMSGAVTSATGFNATNTAINSIQTSGNINACNAGGCVSGNAISIAGTEVATSAGYWIGGINTGLTGNNIFFAGSTGALYARPTGGASSSVSCSGVSDGWLAVTTDNYIVTCIGGSRFRSTLASF